MAYLDLLAMDFGGGSGRGILGRFDGERVSLTEVHRFSNFFVDIQGTYYWSALRMLHETQEAVGRVRLQCPDAQLRSIGLDTWGTDYGLLDHNGQPIGGCRCMRNADGLGVQLAQRRMTAEQLFARTGLQTIYGNTLFQLLERKQRQDPALAAAKALLMLPDLLAYFLTGEMQNEYTIASTSMLLNAQTRTWDRELMRTMDLPEAVLRPVITPGSVRWPVRLAAIRELGYDQLQYVPVASHDTASAVAAAPLQPGELFCSSGTWSLFGAELDEPILTKQAFENNFSNEGGVDGKIRFLKNIMGMWILQQCNAQWQQQGLTLSWPEIVQLAAQAQPFRSFIDPESTLFYTAGRMIEKVQNYCKETAQPVPETPGQIARCVYESIALQYRRTFDQLCAVTQRSWFALRIVGGGSSNQMLDQMIADALDLPVYAGPSEAASIGNILMQAAACGAVSGLAELRRISAASFSTVLFEPRDPARWTDAYGRFLKVTGQAESMQV